MGGNSEESGREGADPHDQRSPLDGRRCARGHGLIYLLGVAKGFGWAAVPQLREPIEAWGGVLWLLAGLLVLTSAALIAVGAPTWWWVLAACGAAVSQVAIVTSWSDARAGTLVNLLLVLVAAYGFASVGPNSFQAQWPERRVAGLYADFHGRIRSGPDAAWMPFTGKQVNTFGASPRRLFIMDATRSGLPVTVLHAYGDATATMRAKALSPVTVVDAAGAEMDRGETVTVFNDLVVLAPGAIVDSPDRRGRPPCAGRLHQRCPDGHRGADVQ
jgi:hypothetical protein